MDPRSVKLVSCWSTAAVTIIIGFIITEWAKSAVYVQEACSLRCTAGLTIRDRLDSMIVLLQLVGLGGAIFRIAIIPLIQVGWIQLGRASISKVLGRLIFRMAKIAWIQVVWINLGTAIDSY